MTEYKIYRVNGSARVTVQTIYAYDWYALFQSNMYSGDPIFKVEVVGVKQEPAA